MKKYALASLCLLSSSVFAQSYTGYPDIPGTAQGYVTGVVSYSLGSGLSDSLMVPSRVIGEPNFYSKQEPVFALGNGGQIVAKFTPMAIKKSNTAEADFYVYEEGPFESFDVYVSADGSNWLKATQSWSDINPASTARGSVVGYDVDLIDSEESVFPYIKIVDTSFSSNSNPGADIDAVVITSGQALGTEVFVDTDSRNGKVYNLYQNDVSGAVGVKIINKDNTVSYVPFSSDASLKAIALSLQGDFNCDDEKDINVLATRANDNVQVNIIKQQDGTAIKTIDNNVTK